MLLNHEIFVLTFACSKTYVNAILEKLPPSRLHLSTPINSVHVASSDSNHIIVETSQRGPEIYDCVILACHTDEARELLADASEQERDVLSSIRWNQNEVILHCDESVSEIWTS